jgi:hypothetical protein
MSLVVFLAFAPAAAFAQAFLDVESGAAFTGYNDLRIPSGTGDLVSLKTDIESAPAYALRVRAGYAFGGRHTVLALAAPLSVHGSGTLDRDIGYQGVTFPAGTKVFSLYRFDSFRLSYRYAFVKSDSLVLAAGLTAKLRSADIAIWSDSAYAHRSDLGLVPLVSLLAEWRFAGPFSLLLDADALATPFGRAEDALLALQYHPSDRAAARIGYRILEGGSEGGGNVYTFALFHYLSAGLRLSL